MALEQQLQAAEELGRKPGQRAGPRPRGGRKTTAECGPGREHRLSAAEAGHSVRQVVLVSLFWGMKTLRCFSCSRTEQLCEPDFTLV